MSGPFSVIVATTHGINGLIGLTDRIKLRPLVAAESGDMSYVAAKSAP